MFQSGNIVPLLENNNLSYIACTESLKHNDIETFCLWMADEHNCRLNLNFLA